MGVRYLRGPAREDDFGSAGGIVVGWVKSVVAETISHRAVVGARSVKPAAEKFSTA